MVTLCNYAPVARGETTASTRCLSSERMQASPLTSPHLLESASSALARDVHTCRPDSSTGCYKMYVPQSARCALLSSDMDSPLPFALRDLLQYHSDSSVSPERAITPSPLVAATPPAEANPLSTFVNATVKSDPDEEDVGFDERNRGESVVSFGEDDHDDFAAQCWRTLEENGEDLGYGCPPDALRTSLMPLGRVHTGVIVHSHADAGHLEEVHRPARAGAIDVEAVRFAPAFATPPPRRTLRSIPYRSDSADTTVDWGDEYSDVASTDIATTGMETPGALPTHRASPTVARISCEPPEGGVFSDSGRRSPTKFSAGRALKSPYRKKLYTARKHCKPMSSMRKQRPRLRKYDQPATDAERTLNATATHWQGMSESAPYLPLTWVLDAEVWRTVRICDGEPTRALALPALARNKPEHVIGKQRIEVSEDKPASVRALMW